MITFAPARCNRRTIAAPTRRAPPVTSTALPARPRDSRACRVPFMVPTILPERIFGSAPADLDFAAISEEARQASARLSARIAGEISAGAFMPFARFMELSLYAPGMGYYAAGAIKLGARGDYVTAPELSPLFGHALAMQAKQVLEGSRASILELGAGTGRMAYDLLTALARLGISVERYSILEVSAELRARQRRTLERLDRREFARIEW